MMQFFPFLEQACAPLFPLRMQSKRSFSARTRNYYKKHYSALLPYQSSIGMMKSDGCYYNKYQLARGEQRATHMCVYARVTV